MWEQIYKSKLNCENCFLIYSVICWYKSLITLSLSLLYFLFSITTLFHERIQGKYGKNYIPTSIILENSLSCHI